jgi:hypothetical protein
MFYLLFFNETEPIKVAMRPTTIVIDKCKDDSKKTFARYFIFGFGFGPQVAQAIL